jgi:hypothetical protein
MRKYKVELTEEQLRLVANCLEDVSRFAAGQWQMRYMVEDILTDLPIDEQLKRRAEAEELLRQAKTVLMPTFPDNGGLGYNGTEFIGNTYQIYRTMLHQIAIDNNWNNVYSSPALPSGNMGIVKIERIDKA